MNPESNLNGQPLPLTTQIAQAKQAAMSRYAALKIHCDRDDMRRLPCGCFCDRGGSFLIAKHCDMGLWLAEEYHVAARRVRELEATQKLEEGDFEPAPVSAREGA